MTSTGAWQLWSMRAAFCMLCVLILLFDLLPLQTMPRHWAGPDLLFCFAMVWSVRRPDYVPILMLAALFLLADLLLSRPPGLCAALMLLACSDLQNKSRRLRDAGFVAEWGRSVTLIIGVALTYRLALGLTMVPTPPLGLHGFQTIMTALAYPFVILASALLFGGSLASQGDLDGMGSRS